WPRSRSLPSLPRTRARTSTASLLASSWREGPRRSVTTDVLDVAEGAPRGGFSVHLDNFEGPFDLLLSLISKHQLEITEVALGAVTDEFLATVMAAGTEWELDGASEFLVVAATLLDLKAARLLP